MNSESIRKGFVKGKSGNPATQFQPGRSGNPHGRPKGRHQTIARVEIPATLRKSLKLKIGATYQDVIALARIAAGADSSTQKQEEGVHSC